MKLSFILCIWFFSSYAAGNEPRLELQNPLFEDLGALYQGDIILQKGRNAMLLEDYKWPDGIVPYVFHPSFTGRERARVVSAMRQLTRQLCVRFVERTDEQHYVAVGKRRELGCSSMVGRQPDATGGQTLNLRSPECLQQAGVIQHELLHALGLMHEQARPDRDRHVRVLWENIHPDYKSDFEKAPEEYVSTYDVPYDYASIMHYPNNAFSKNKKNTIIAKVNPKLQLGQRKSPTEKDLEKVRRMYNCASS